MDRLILAVKAAIENYDGGLAEDYRATGIEEADKLYCAIFRAVIDDITLRDRKFTERSIRSGVKKWHKNYSKGTSYEHSVKVPLGDN